MIQYSTAVCPPDAVVEQVFQLRAGLKQITGPFGREKTEAHCTVNVFVPSALAAWRMHLRERLSVAEPFDVCFSVVSVFPASSEGKYNLVLLPEEPGNTQLKTLMKSVNTKTPKSFYKIANPHITIAYELNEEQKHKALMYFNANPVDIRFTIDNLAFRKRKDGPYEFFQVFERFYFKTLADTLLF